MIKVTISANIQVEKKQLAEILLKRVNLTTDDIIDSAFTQFIRANSDLITEKDRITFGNYLVKL